MNTFEDDAAAVATLNEDARADLYGRIDACMAALDRVLPDWLSLVDVDDLDMSEPWSREMFASYGQEPRNDTNGCLLAQIWGRYGTGRDRFSALLGEDVDPDAFALAVDYNDDWTFHEVTAAWRIKLRERVER